MKFFVSLVLVAILTPARFAPAQNSATFSCPMGKSDMMTYFVMAKPMRTTQFMHGSANSIYTEVFPDEDFAEKGYWFWLKSPKAHGFDVKAFDRERVYMRSTELTWTDNTTFKRFEKDLPIAERCVLEGKPGAPIKDRHKVRLLRVVQGIAPAMADIGGNLGQHWTRVPALPLQLRLALCKLRG